MGSRAGYVHGLADDARWGRSGTQQPGIGIDLAELWVRNLIDEDPQVFECKLEANTELPPHSYPTLVIQWFTDGSVQFDGEGAYEEGDVRILPAATNSPPALASPVGARFYLFSIGGPASARDSDPAADGGRARRVRLRDLSWDVFGRGDHVMPPGLVKIVYDDGQMYLRLARMDPGSVIGPHSHPGNIMYLVTRGALEIPGEVRMQVGDARWARANTFYPGEVAERDGVEFIFLQAGTNDHAVWWGTDTPAAAN